mmetsp:Transcript_43570/g.110303  ORF Transcript_43570/g.110303 Transcript_43570/m.110303 type:complete len:236 (-) Transcript_43570:141-848(-)
MPPLVVMTLNLAQFLVQLPNLLLQVFHDLHLRRLGHLVQIAPVPESVHADTLLRGSEDVMLGHELLFLVRGGHFLIVPGRDDRLHLGPGLGGVSEPRDLPHRSHAQRICHHAQVPLYHFTPAADGSVGAEVLPPLHLRAGLLGARIQQAAGLCQCIAQALPPSQIVQCLHGITFSLLKCIVDRVPPAARHLASCFYVCFRPRLSPLESSILLAHGCLPLPGLLMPQRVAVLRVSG